jgi:hypothetical protein
VFEVFEEIAPKPAPDASALYDWLDTITLPDGGLPFGLPIADPAGCAPFFVDPDATPVLAAHDQHACRDRAPDRPARQDCAGHALEFRFALQLLDAAHDLVPDAGAELRRLGGFLPASGSMAVAGGIADEAMRPLDFAPEPDRPIHALFRGATIEADLYRLVAEQRDDGGAAARSSYYSMAFSHGLAGKGYTVETVDTQSEVTFQPGEGITQIALTVKARCPVFPEEEFRAAAEDAKLKCPEVPRQPSPGWRPRHHSRRRADSCTHVRSALLGGPRGDAEG